MSKYTPHRREVENAWAHRFNDMDVNNIEQYDAEIDRFIVSIRAAALDEAAEVAVRYAKAPTRFGRERIIAGDIEHRIRALKEEKK